MGTQNIYYDPNDSTDIQIASYDRYGGSGIDISEMANDSGVKFLIDRNLQSLYYVRELKAKLRAYELDNTHLRDEREELRITLAAGKGSAVVDIVSIPLTLLGGFALNMLWTNLSDGLGWVVFILCMVVVIVLKFPGVRNTLSRPKRSEGEKTL